MTRVTMRLRIPQPEPFRHNLLLPHQAFHYSIIQSLKNFFFRFVQFTLGGLLMEWSMEQIESKYYQIGELADLVSMSTRTIRYYEENGSTNWSS
jgi:hypothetical protein